MLICVSGKEWIGELQAHEESCGFVEVLYPNRCGVKHLLRKGIEDYIKKCPYRPFSCPWCNEAGDYVKMASDYHLSICPRVIVTCPNAGCEVKIIRAEIEDHRKQCSHQAILCKYNSLGCMFTVLRKDERILRHHEADISGHLESAVINPGSPSVTIKFSTNSGP